jgi:hypothetical protein
VSAQTAADLRAAADVLERDGWTQGSFKDQNGCRCAAGAISKVALDRFPEDSDFNFDEAFEDALDALRAFVGKPVVVWNDERGRTAAEVIAALRAAADAVEAGS